MMITKGRIWEEHRYCPLVARNHILASLCPQVSGVYVVKLAVAMVMAGSVAGRISSAAGRGPRTVVSGSWRPRAGGRRTLLHRRVQLHQGAGQDETRPWSSRAAAAQRRHKLQQLVEEKMQAYFCLVKTVNPVLSNDAANGADGLSLLCCSDQLTTRQPSNTSRTLTAAATNGHRCCQFCSESVNTATSRGERQQRSTQPLLTTSAA